MDVSGGIGPRSGLRVAGLRRRRTVPAGDAGKVAPAPAAHMSNSS
jgi:hypothetical protein